MARDIDACTEEPPARADRCVGLGALSERVFTPKRVSLMLNELLHRQEQAQTAEDARLITLKKELDRATTGLDRLYQAVEDGALSIDETLQTRAQKLKARRREVLTEMAKLRDRQALAVRRVNADTVKAFCAALKDRFHDPASFLGNSVPAPAGGRKSSSPGASWSSAAATGGSRTRSASCRKKKAGGSAQLR